MTEVMMKCSGRVTFEVLARNWLNNRRIVDDWIDEYAERTGKTRSEVVAERQAHWVHDERAEHIGGFKGFQLYGCPVYDGLYRYTVITPWGMSEGLHDSVERDDDKALDFLECVVESVFAM